MSTNIAVVNTKGGSSKSTVTMQVAGAYFLSKGLDVQVSELDDENQDSKTFTETAIKTEQVEVGDYKDLVTTLRKLLISKEINRVLDVGGNRTTTEFINALEKSRMFKMIDLFIIPISSGNQDVTNAIKTYELLKKFDTKIIFALSRSRHRQGSRVKLQYRSFFKHFKDEEYFILRDSDVVDLSRMMKKTCYELATDTDNKTALENQLDEVIEKGEESAIQNISVMLEIFDEAEDFYKNDLKEAFELLEKSLVKDESTPEKPKGKK
jgi:hypothetical protein